MLKELTWGMVLVAAACGARTGTELDSFAIMGVGGNTGAGTGGGSSARVSTGGAPQSGTGGIATVATGGGPCAGSVTFQVNPRSDSFCLGTLGACAGDNFYTIYGASQLTVKNNCFASCDSCKMTLCNPTACALGGIELPANGLTFTWSGQFFEDGMCGTTSCMWSFCAKGSYMVQVCGFPNPTPGYPEGCATTAPVGTTCTLKSFDYPATAPVNISW